MRIDVRRGMGIGPSVPVSVRGLLLILGLVGVLTIAAFAITIPRNLNPPPPKWINILYSVDSRHDVDVVYGSAPSSSREADLTREQGANGLFSEFKKIPTAKDGETVTLVLTASVPTEGGSVTCSIMNGGETLDKQTAAYPSTSVTCSAQLPAS